MGPSTRRASPRGGICAGGVGTWHTHTHTRTHAHTQYNRYVHGIARGGDVEAVGAGRFGVVCERSQREPFRAVEEIARDHRERTISRRGGAREVTRDAESEI